MPQSNEDKENEAPEERIVEQLKGNQFREYKLQNKIRQRYESLGNAQDIWSYREYVSAGRKLEAAGSLQFASFHQRCIVVQSHSASLLTGYMQGTDISGADRHEEASNHYLPAFSEVVAMLLTLSAF
jgi:hypothetical protein